MSKDTLVSQVKRIMENDELNEMAQLTGALEAAIKAVIEANPDLEKLALKKAIKADADVKSALGDQELYDNQLNRFIDLAKGDRELGQRGRKPGSGNASVGKSAVDKFTQGLTAEYTPEEKSFIQDMFASVTDDDADVPMEEAETVELSESFKRMTKLAGVGVIKG